MQHLVSAPVLKRLPQLVPVQQLPCCLSQETIPVTLLTEHLSCRERLGELRLISLDKRRLQDDLRAPSSA